MRGIIDLSILESSKFRQKFKLTGRDVKYIRSKGEEKIRQHAFDLISKRLAAASPLKDGKQTPFKGHPVFVAQHATGTCCRECLKKWHYIQPGVALTDEQINYVVTFIMEWINDQMKLRGKEKETQSKKILKEI